MIKWKWCEHDRHTIANWRKEVFETGTLASYEHWVAMKCVEDLELELHNREHQLMDIQKTLALCVAELGMPPEPSEDAGAWAQHLLRQIRKGKASATECGTQEAPAFDGRLRPDPLDVEAETARSVEVLKKSAETLVNSRDFIEAMSQAIIHLWEERGLRGVSACGPVKAGQAVGVVDEPPPNTPQQ